MHRIWVGLDPQIIMSVVGSFVAGTVLVIHIFAFNQLNWPGTLKAKYATPSAAAVTR